MEYICMICGRKKHVLREGKVMLCTRCITALGLALNDKIHPGDTPGDASPDPPADSSSAGGLSFRQAGHLAMFRWPSMPGSTASSADDRFFSCTVNGTFSFWRDKKRMWG